VLFHIILINVQRDTTQSSLFIILRVHITCFGCQPHPSSGVHKSVTTASGTGLNFCAATSLHRGQSRVHKTVTTASGTVHIFCAATSRQRGQAWASWPQNCNYSLRYWSHFLCSYLSPTWPSLGKLATEL